MSIASFLKRLTKALPVVLAAAPSVIEAANQVGKALKKPKNPAAAGTGAAAANGAPLAPPRLSADSERDAR
ncbi:MAG: hypothetical protein QOJ27_1086 [Sphingomonadales bacterium]|jgi:hypothetical protein|nr:hypothetical protein [Sphingomonadales bacterium]